MHRSGGFGLGQSDTAEQGLEAGIAVKREVSWVDGEVGGLAVAAVAPLSAGIGCGHSSSQPASTAPTTQLAVKGNYTVTVTGTSANGAVHSVTLTVTVQ